MCPKWAHNRPDRPHPVRIRMLMRSKKALFLARNVLNINVVTGRSTGVLSGDSSTNQVQTERISRPHSFACGAGGRGWVVQIVKSPRPGAGACCFEDERHAVDVDGFVVALRRIGRSNSSFKRAVVQSGFGCTAVAYRISGCAGRCYSRHSGRGRCYSRHSGLMRTKNPLICIIFRYQKPKGEHAHERTTRTGKAPDCNGFGG